MSYAAKTFADRNPVKRLFQRARLNDALHLARGVVRPRLIIDFGAGNGELCRLLSRQFPGAGIVCYEPHPELLAEALENLAGVEGVTFLSDPERLPRASADLLFCLEVLEHLPEREFDVALDQVEAMLAGDGVAIIGVPVETGFPAFYKGLFRVMRRPGDFDARPGNIVSAMLGRPPGERPAVELMPGSWFHLHHLGFDHRRFRRELERRFEVQRHSASPVPWLGEAVNSEVTFRVKNRKAGTD
jgi:SAM-dependent methyltransferase